MFISCPLFQKRGSWGVEQFLLLLKGSPALCPALFCQNPSTLPPLYTPPFLPHSSAMCCHTTYDRARQTNTLHLPGRRENKACRRDWATYRREARIYLSCLPFTRRGTAACMPAWKEGSHLYQALCSMPTHTAGIQERRRGRPFSFSTTLISFFFALGRLLHSPIYWCVSPKLLHWKRRDIITTLRASLALGVMCF